MSTLAPWAQGPFELLVHAEEHRLRGGDFDRRIALIGFDNAIEVVIATYLTLHPIQRGNRSYKQELVNTWLQNFHTRLDFLNSELADRNLIWLVERSHIVWAHEQRNDQYHHGRKGTPETHVLDLIRRAALWIFSTLFEIPDAESLLTYRLTEGQSQAPIATRKFDIAIDSKYGMIAVGDQEYYTSETLLAVDPEAYRELGQRLCESRASEESEQET